MPMPLHQVNRSPQEVNVSSWQGGYGSREEFDLMHVQITVYSLTGIAIRANGERGDRRSSSRQRIEQWRHHQPEQIQFNQIQGNGWQQYQQSPYSQGNDWRLHQSQSPFNQMSVATDISSQYETSSGAIPTTAVVSVRRNLVGSGSAMETFLPSQSLNMPSPGTDTRVRQTVFWGGGGQSFSRSGGGEGDTIIDTERATFNMSRVMQRQSNAAMQNMGKYMPETVEIHVGLGRGKDMISLGAALVSVMGDEAGETITNIPVKIIDPEKGKRGLFKANQWKRNKQRGTFRDAPEWSYALDENATLRVGVKVAPVGAKTSEKKKKRSIVPAWKTSSSNSDTPLGGILGCMTCGGSCFDSADDTTSERKTEKYGSVDSARARLRAERKRRRRRIESTVLL